MIETIENAVQMLFTLVCTCVAIYYALRYKSRVWALLGLFSGIFFLGDLYWQLFLIFYADTPRYYSVSDLSWYTSYLFLLLLLIYIRLEGMYPEGLPQTKPHGIGEQAKQWFNQTHPLVWCTPVFTGAMCVFFMQWGDYISNIIAALLMTGLIWHALSGLLTIRKESMNGGHAQNTRRMLFLVTLLFCAAEYGLWISSCFWMGDTIANVYFWFGFLLSITFLLFIPALRKVVGR